TGDGARDCMVDLDQAPTVHCFHNSCRGILDGVNRELRSRIGKAECGERSADSDNSRSQTKNNTEQKTAAKHNFTLMSVKDVLAGEDKEDLWIWDGILPANGMSLLVAKPKVGKTTFALNLAIAVAHGAEFLCKATTQGPVVYLALEENRSQVKKKLKSLGI